MGMSAADVRLQQTYRGEILKLSSHFLFRREFPPLRGMMITSDPPLKYRIILRSAGHGKNNRCREAYIVSTHDAGK